MIIKIKDKEISVDEIPEWYKNYYWFISSKGYLRGKDIHGKNYVFHRLLLGLDIGDKRIVDHINRNRLDNRKSNLRIVTLSQSVMNRKSPNGRYGGTYLGENKKWYIQIWANKKLYYGGKGYKDREDAVQRANEMRKELHGEYACLV